MSVDFEMNNKYCEEGLREPGDWHGQPSQVYVPGASVPLPEIQNDSCGDGTVSQDLEEHWLFSHCQKSFYDPHSKTYGLFETKCEPPTDHQSLILSEPCKKPDEMAHTCNLSTSSATWEVLGQLAWSAQYCSRDKTDPASEQGGKGKPALESCL